MTLAFAPITPALVHIVTQRWSGAFPPWVTAKRFSISSRQSSNARARERWNVEERKFKGAGGCILLTDIDVVF